MKRATKVRLYPTDEQATFLNAQFGAVRFVYNKALHIQCHMFKRHGVSLKPNRDLKPLLAVAKKSRKYGWHSFIVKLEYKAQAAGRHLIKLDRWFATNNRRWYGKTSSKMRHMPWILRY